MIRQRVAFVELTVFAGVYPLASGYMRAAATLNPRIRESCSFEIHSICINDQRFEDKLNKIDADVYAISCYVWNMGFVKRWLPSLIARKPEAHIILGGPQVMNHGKLYLDPGNERLVLCNGEGEHTFAAYLDELCSPEPDFNRVKGLSFYAGGTLVTTGDQERIKDLNEIPSPYLEGYFGTGSYVWAPLETNRGCPYQCTYCFWGAATNSRVYRSDMDRVKAEIEWLSQRRAMYFFITDANFGMLSRDIEIAQHVADCKKKYGYPLTVWFSAAKNSPERVTEITRILSEQGLISTQPVSLQTMDETTLKSVKRGNIRESAYLQLQDDLRRSNLSSFVEMIWPLPGETLESFKTGIGKLCRYDADAILIHHLLLINNVPMNAQRDEYRLEVANDVDPNSEAQVVVGTRDVSRDEYKEGVRFGYHLTSLYSLRGLRLLGRHLDSSGRLSFKELISSFSDYCNRFPDHPYMQYIASIIQGSAQTRFSANGGIFHNTLHEFRRDFDQLLLGFVRDTRLVDDEDSWLLFELDLLNRPHVYYNTPISNGDGILRLLQVIARERDGLVLSMPERWAERAAALVGLEGAGTRLKVSYRSTQMPFMESKPYEDNLSYCEAKLHKMGSILPAWRAAETSVSPSRRALAVVAG